MKISSGLFENAVFQRNAKDVCDQIIEGSASYDGELLVTVSKNKKPLSKFKDLECGYCKKGNIRGKIEGIPVGGPYLIELSLVSEKGKVLDTLKFKDVMVGDLWLLGGQSNMEGVGNLADALPPIDEVKAYYMNNVWKPAEDPIHNLWQAAAPVHGGNPAAKAAPRRVKGVGPGVAFGQDMYKRTKVPQGLISCAHGGTKMTQWDPELKKLGDKSLYGAMYNRLQRLGGKVAGMIWYQGCSDANAADAALFTERMLTFIKEVRKDTGNATLPIVMVQISRVCDPSASDECWTSIREQQRLLPEKVKNILTVPAIDLDLDDLIHISGEDQHVLGKRMASAMAVLKGIQKKKELPPIKLKSIKVGTDKLCGNPTVTVTFANVAGKLEASDRPAGFSLRDSRIFKTEVANDYVVLHITAASVRDLSRELMYYGYGINPYCNIRDSEERPLPAFGPVPLGNGKCSLTRFVQNALCSEPVFVPEKDLKTMKNLSEAGGLKFVKCNFTGFYLDHPSRVALATAEDKIFFYKASFSCKEAMKLNLLAGYDGPVKIFADGKVIFEDMKGTNPIIRDYKEVPLKWSKGEHEVVFAMASNNGRAWGICLRFERTDAVDINAALPEEIVI